MNRVQQFAKEESFIH